jgi:hypothetical protein
MEAVSPEVSVAVVEDVRTLGRKVTGRGVWRFWARAAPYLDGGAEGDRCGEPGRGAEADVCGIICQKDR